MALFTKESAIFLAKFFIAFAVLFAIVETIPLPPLYGAIANIEATLLKSIGITATISRTTISVPNASFNIVAECSGLVMASMLAALLYASKAESFWKKLLLGASALMLFNVARLFLTLLSAAAWGQQALGIVHPLLWFVDAGAVVVIWAKMEELL